MMKKNPLLSGSLILFIGMMAGNLSNYFYHWLMGRMLGPKDYGSLTSLISLAYLLSIVSTTMSTTVVKFATRYKAKDDYESLSGFFKRLIKVFFVFGSAVLLFFVLAKNQIGVFLKLTDPFPVVWVGVWMSLSFLSFINDGILRGFLKFSFLSLNGVWAAILKLGLAVILVRAGWAVGGAVAAIALGAVFPYLLSFYPLRFLWFYKNGEKNVDWRGFIGYTAQVLVATLGLTSLYSTDVILARHFLGTVESGLYAALATMGKIVFFASGVIPTVMFPLISERFEKGKNYRKIITQALCLVLAECLAVSAIYFLFPQLMIELLYGSAYLRAAPFLGWFAVFISFYSLNNLLVNFFLSVGRVKMSWLPLVAAGLQAGLIWLFHQSINQIIRVSLGVSVLLLAVLLVCYKQNDKKRE